MPDSNVNSSDRGTIGHAYNWLDSHGQTSYQELKKLAEAGTPESSERLRQLADDNNISYDDTTNLMQLLEEIYSAMEKDGNTGVE